jgi:redox-sensitive bicupin YhaK (pirin superfamily)
MVSPARPRSVRIVPGEIETKVVTTRLLVPSTGQPSWAPFRRVAESTASRGRQLPAHAHEREEVLTYVTEGFASYQLESGPPEALPRGSARLLTAPSRASHRVSPAKGGAVRWFNLVWALPAGSTGTLRLQTMGPETPTNEEDTVGVRTIMGPGAPMASAAGIECQERLFTAEGTTFRRLGPNRRAIVYALSGRGTVNQREIEGGEAAFIEGLQGIAVQGGDGFRALLTTAPA